MKKKYLFPLAMLLALPFINGCNNQSNNLVMINSFESTNDLYKFKTANTDVTNVVKYDLNSDIQYITEGNSSLKMEITSGVIEELMFPFAIKDRYLFEISKLSSVNIDIFNASNNDVTVSLNIYNSNSFNVLLTNTYTLKANQLTSINYPLSAIAIKNNYDTIKGLTLRFTNENKATYYIDNFYVTLGNKLSSEDKIYEKEITAIEQLIAELPEECGIDDYDTLNNVYSRYIALPVLYRNIISNYSDLFKAIQQYNEAYNALDSEDPLSKTAFRFDDFTGVGSLYNHAIVGGNLKYYYSQEVRYADEKGSIELNFFGNVWNYMGYTLPNDISDYDYLIFHFYNVDEENNQTKRVYFGWNGGYVDCPVNTWTEAKVTPDTLLNSTYGMIVNQLNNGIATNSSGKLYISKVTAYRTSYKKITNPFNSETPFISDTANISVNEENVINIKAKQAGDISLKLNKTSLNISSDEACKLVIYSPIKTTLELVTLDGEVISSNNINIGYNYINISHDEYNLMVEFIFKAVTINQDIQVVSSFLYKTQYENMVATLQLLNGISNNIDINNIDDVLTFFETYSTLSTDDIDNINEFMPNFNEKVDAITNQIKDGTLLTSYVNRKLANPNSEFTLLKSLANNEIINKYCDESLVNSLKENTKLYDEIYGSESTIKSGIDYQWNGSISKSFDDSIGNCFDISITKMLFNGYIQFEFDSIPYDGYKTTTMYIYNPLNRDVNGNYFNVNPSSGAWENVSGFVLTKLSWNKISFSSNAANGNRSFIMLMGDLVSNGWKVSYLYGLTYKATAEAISNKIALLNDTIESDMDKEQVACVKKQYDELDVSARKYVTNSAKLENLAKNVTDLEVAKVVDNTTFSLVNNESSDFSHGPLFTGNVNSSSANAGGGFIGVIKNKELKVLEQYKEVYFYIYIEDDIAGAKFLRQYDVNWAGIFSGTFVKGYNKITISGKEWYNSNTNEAGSLYLYLCGDGTSHLFGITNFYGVK